MTIQTTQPTTQNSPDTQTQPQPLSIDELYMQFGPSAPHLKELFERFHGAMYKELQDRFEALTETNKLLMREVDELRKQVPDLQTLAAALAGGRDKVEAVRPSNFEGKAEQVDSFVTAVKLYIKLKPKAFPDEDTKISFALQLFSGKAEPWARSAITRMLDGKVVYATFDLLEEAIRTNFGNFSRVEEARRNLETIKYVPKEGLGAVINQFRPEADASNFDDKTLVHFLRKILPPHVQLQFAGVNSGVIPTKIDDWYRLGHLLDSAYVSAQQTQIAHVPSQRSIPSHRTPPAPTSTPATTTTSSQASAPTAMDVDGHRRSYKPQCYRCGEYGHMQHQCKKPEAKFLRASDTEELIARAVKTALEKVAPTPDFPSGQQ